MLHVLCIAVISENETKNENENTCVFLCFVLTFVVRRK